MNRFVCAAFCALSAFACSNNQPAHDATSESADLRPASRTVSEAEDEATRDAQRDEAAPRRDRDDDDAAMRPADDGAADDTARNRRDVEEETLTPFDQSNDESDLEVSQKIRQAVMDDRTLSFTAKNVKIITVDGRVTLRGPVKNAQERAAIESAARRVAGAGNVVSELEVEGEDENNE